MTQLDEILGFVKSIDSRLEAVEDWQKAEDVKRAEHERIARNRYRLLSALTAVFSTLAGVFGTIFALWARK